MAPHFLKFDREWGAFYFGVVVQHSGILKAGYLFSDTLQVFFQDGSNIERWIDFPMVRLCRGDYLRKYGELRRPGVERTPLKYAMRMKISG